MDTSTGRRARVTPRTRIIAALGVFLMLAAFGAALPSGAPAEQASHPASPAAGRLAAGKLDAGDRATCAVVSNGRLRCWGFGGNGELGYGNRNNVGDDETPGSVGPVDLGSDASGMPLTTKAVAVGDYHSCALLNDGTVRCWGFGGNGRLGYGNTNNIGDDPGETGSVGPVDLGTDPTTSKPHTATAISAGGGHTCALLDNGRVRCWGFGDLGQLGYPAAVVTVPPTPYSIGDDPGETPGSVGPVDLGTDPTTGTPRTATAISAGGNHTCALLDNGDVRCWGEGASGALGYGSRDRVGDDESPGSAGPVNLGTDPSGTPRTAKAIASGAAHTCALLDDDSVRCWGFAGSGELGYANTNSIGDDPGETPGSVGPVDLGTDPTTSTPRTAKAISAGDHTCALLDDDTVRCWGGNRTGQLGYGNTVTIGDNETPGSVGPVSIGGKAIAITAGRIRTCVRLDDGNVRCWGFARSGRLGYCTPDDIGDDEVPASVGPIALETPGAPCSVPPGDGGTGGGGTGGGLPGPTSGTGTAPSGGAANTVDPLRLQELRKRALRRCLVQAARKSQRLRSRARRACLKRHGRTPGRIKNLRARAASKTKIVLSFNAPGTDGVRPPAARAYLVKQSLKPIRDARSFARAQSLCKGRCSLLPPKITGVGAKIRLTIRDLRPGTTYYYAVSARDNVSRRLGARSAVVKAKTR